MPRPPLFQPPILNDNGNSSGVNSLIVITPQNLSSIFNMSNNNNWTDPSEFHTEQAPSDAPTSMVAPTNDLPIYIAGDIKEMHRALKAQLPLVDRKPVIEAAQTQAATTLSKPIQFLKDNPLVALLLIGGIGYFMLKDNK